MTKTESDELTPEQQAAIKHVAAKIGQLSEPLRGPNIQNLPPIDTPTDEDERLAEKLDVGLAEAIGGFGNQLQQLQEPAPVGHNKPPVDFPHVRAGEVELQLERFEMDLEDAFDHAEDGELADLFKVFFAAQAFHKKIDTIRKRINATITKYDKQVLPSLLEDKDIDKLRVPSIGRSFYVLNKASASVADKEEAYDWLRSRGDGDLITETVHSGTLASYLSNYIDDEAMDPPECFNFSTYKKIGSSKYTPKK